MLIFLDLDGTLINTVHPSWKPYKDGQEGYPIEPILAQIPVFPGAREFILSRRRKGDKVVVVSDSHYRYVNPICNSFEVDCVSLADKPNIQKIDEFFIAHPDYRQELDNGNCVVVGDTKLDIEFGRRLGAMTVWFLPYQITDEIRDERDGIGDELLCKKMGPTYAAKSYEEIESILDNPLSHLYTIEAACVGMESTRSIRLNYNRYGDGSFASIRCLARQEEGASDKYARAVSYYMLSNPQRTPEFLQTMSKGISCYINQPLLMERGWDFFTYLTDKSTTTPPYKMRELFDMVETTIPKLQLLKWADDVQGSLREQNLYADRQSFLQRYLTVDCPTDSAFTLSGKNIIVLDDQLTTGATAWHVIRSLKEKGAKNVLFIAMFQMVLPVHNNVICPRCGKPMLIKMRRSDGHRFYSCTPPEFRGDGCGFIQDILE